MGYTVGMLIFRLANSKKRRKDNKIRFKTNTKNKRNTYNRGSYVKCLVFFLSNIP